MALADTVIFLDFLRLLCVWQVLLRVLNYRRGMRPDMAEGCDERLDWAFLRYVWTFPERHRPLILEKLAQPRPQQRIVTLRSPSELECFLRQLAACYPVP